jgi:hypothetical protein
LLKQIRYAYERSKKLGKPLARPRTRINDNAHFWKAIRRNFPSNELIKKSFVDWEAKDWDSICHEASNLFRKVKSDPKFYGLRQEQIPTDK